MEVRFWRWQGCFWVFALALNGYQVKRTHWIIDGEYRCGYQIQAQYNDP
ncbi:hypothetical protein C1752_02913 [Acaryochloris thomasi RCC1774]|uniref:Uncharacterized protein n=1 Tax=Acaryochloris thomasi RCC1774 TaxID=1764569 RepID=A0A2W1JNX1_9CYAN|nr:hypothetical protein [Acaryochloris thomasi]PZD73135.1 hypothetical protein C1752_02913 [Acaryochloris thomasi RCC1774]